MVLNNEEKVRYSRHLILDKFGETAQLKLKNASVLVVGAGGLGSPCLLYLAAAGVGHLGIADDDVVSLSNLQRQVLYHTDNIGKLKCEVAREKLLAQNPNLQISLFRTRITADNALEILNDFDVIIDGSDNFATRYLINDACVILRKPLIYGAIHKFEGQVSCFNYKDGPTYRCLFPEPPAQGEMPGCGEVGVIGVLPGIIGTWQATEAIKIITRIGEPLSGKLLMIDLLNNDISLMNFQSIAANKEIKQLSDYQVLCVADNINTINAETLSEWIKEKDIQLIDVREEIEYKCFNIGGINIPLSKINENMNLLDPVKHTIVVCRSGTRSRNAIGKIKERYPAIQIFNLEAGLNSIKS